MGVSLAARSQHLIEHLRKVSKREGVIVIEAIYASREFPKGVLSMPEDRRVTCCPGWH
jgi:hypothetical protein